MAGGAPGARGRQRLVRAGGETVELAAIDGCRAGAGDRLVVETPGGGGWGAPVGGDPSGRGREVPARGAFEAPARLPEDAP
jgi:5-oxoprolinase (ATP-hydrolysing)